MEAQSPVRTKFNGSSRDLHALASEIVGRANLAAKMGLQYGGDRDIYQALGYKVHLTYDDFMARYQRQDIAKAVIDRPVRVTWQGPLELVESSEAEDTEFEKAWKELNRRLGLKTRFSRVDKLTGIGQYGILLLGLDDVTNQGGFEKPVAKGKRKLVYVKPFGEKNATITTYEDDTQNERYGQPLIYTIDIIDMATKRTSTVRVHHSRIVHIIDDILESEVKGAPRLECIFNRLMDLEKLVGGDAEMFWRGARPGFSGVLNPDYQMTETTKNDLKEQIDEYEHDLRRILINEGIDLKALAQQIADPEKHVDAQLTMISAVTGIPKRILSGSERGELASTQDTSEWREYVQGRRDDHAEPHIVRPFVDRLIQLGVLPEPAEDYTVRWVDLYSQSEKAKVEIGKGRANAIREYTSNPIAQAIMPPKAFMEFCMGFDMEQITLINKMRDEEISEEELSNAIMESITEPKPDETIKVEGGKEKPVKKPVKV